MECSIFLGVWLKSVDIKIGDYDSNQTVKSCFRKESTIFGQIHGTKGYKESNTYCAKQNNAIGHFAPKVCDNKYAQSKFGVPSGELSA